MKQKILFALPVVGLLTICVLVSGIGSTPLPQEPDKLPSIRNKTQGFETVDVERATDHLHFRFKNHYEKTVTAFQVSFSSEFKITEDMIFSELEDVGLKPQDVFEKTYPLPASLQQQRSFDVTINAVMLDDGSGDGDTIALQEIKDARLGEAIQIRRTLNSVQSFLDEGGQDISRLRTEVTRQLSVTNAGGKEAGISKGVKADSNRMLSTKLEQGLDNGRQNALRKISEIESLSDKRSGLVKLKDTYNKILNRL